jgi:hypothetical protein
MTEGLFRREVRFLVTFCRAGQKVTRHSLPEAGERKSFV